MFTAPKSEPGAYGTRAIMPVLSHAHTHATHPTPVHSSSSPSPSKVESSRSKSVAVMSYVCVMPSCSSQYRVHRCAVLTGMLRHRIIFSPTRLLVVENRSSIAEQRELPFCRVMYVGEKMMHANFSCSRGIDAVISSCPMGNPNKRKKTKEKCFRGKSKDHCRGYHEPPRQLPPWPARNSCH